MSDINRPAMQPSRIRVKICGITNEADALLAIDCGADALGFNFWPGSKRCLDIATAESWMGRLPQGVSKVAVLVDPTLDHAWYLAARTFIDSLQLHGNESPAFCRNFAERGIAFTKALPVSGPDSLARVDDFSTASILLDSASSRGFGGTGQTFPWSIARSFIEKHPNLEVILAGGLTPDNVGEAIRQVRPFGVDVTTGVESSTGRKDPERLRAFISAVRGL